MPELFNPFVVTGWLRWIYPTYLWKGEPGNNNVYLTFDDGPHAEVTDWVLNLLEEFNAASTFFVVGKNALQNPQLIEKIKQGGHKLGNHTQNHKKGWNTSTEEYVQDADVCEAISQTKIFRPPYGRITKEQGITLKRKGYKIVMWTLLSRDYDTGLNCKQSLAILKKNTRAGSIIVFHDSLKASPQLKMILPEYLQFLKDKGFNFATL